MPSRNRSAYRAAARAGLIGCLAAAITAGQGGAAERQQHSHKHDAQANQTPPAPIAKAVPPVIIKIEPSAEEVHRAANKEAADRRIFGQQPEVWTFWLNLLLVIGTGFLWFATNKNAIAAKKAAIVAERALVELERPYVFLRFGNAGFENRMIERVERGGGDVEITFAARFDGPFERLFVNFGRSPAILTEILDNFDKTAGLGAMPYPIDPNTQRGKKFPVGTISANGDPHKVSNSAYLAFGRKRIEPDAFENHRFFCNGYIRYEDVFGGQYVLGYCARFDPASRSWVLDGGDGYNYTRVERDPRNPKSVGLVERLIGKQNT